VESDSAIRAFTSARFRGSAGFFPGLSAERKLQLRVRVVVLMVPIKAGFLCYRYAGNTSCMRYMTLLLLYAVAGNKQQLRPMVAT
jgi:hypothetical protein